MSHSFKKTQETKSNSLGRTPTTNTWKYSSAVNAIPVGAYRGIIKLLGWVSAAQTEKDNTV